MRHIMFSEENERYPIALLIKQSSFNKGELLRNYVEPLETYGVSRDDVIAFSLTYHGAKVSSAQMKEYLDELLPVLKELDTKLLYVADANYFKTLTKQAKTEPHHGYVLPCAIKGYEDLNVVLGINYQQIVYNPELKDKVNLGLKAVAEQSRGTYIPLGQTIIHSVEYPATVPDIAAALQKLHAYPELACDIEGFSLRFNEAGIGTIAFAWDKHNGIAFACDYRPSLAVENCYGKNVPNPQVRALLREFFTTYKGRITWHNASYDIKAIIHALWMDDLLDRVGMMDGFDVMTKAFDDTKVITYLATNSTAGNILGLKPLAHEFAGNWAVEEINDITKIPLPDLLQYNLVDALSTNYVKGKYYPIMVEDEQEELYKGLMLSSLKLIIQMEMIGMPMVPEKIQSLKGKLQAIDQGYLDVLKSSPVIKDLEEHLAFIRWEKDFEGRRAKAKHPEKIQPKNWDTFPREPYNPNSSLQTQALLYDLMKLPVIDLTDTRLPATGGDTLKKLKDFTTKPEYLEILEALIGHADCDKILTAFIPAFERAILKDDGYQWLHGSFNLGGTVSGRLSSSDPNLQNLPANSTYGKLVKECFAAPPGWLFCGADFMSLEDRINALLTKDKNKLKVYQGHVIYELTINGVTHHIRDDATIGYEGKTYSGKEFYETFGTL